MFFSSRFLLSVVAGTFFVTGAFGAIGTESATVAKLLAEKQQKMAKLEQCAKKVKGFKIAGISTLGLTAAGVGGNIVLASKQKDISRQIVSTKTQIEKKQAELETLNKKIDDAKEQKRIDDEKHEAEEQRLNNCPGNLYKSIQSLCPGCVTADDREKMCDFNINGEDWAKKNGDKIVFDAMGLNEKSGVFEKKCACDNVPDEAVDTQENSSDKKDEVTEKQDKDEKKDDNKGGEKEEKVSGIIKGDCNDTEKHISEGVYEEFASGTLSCYKTEKDTNVVKCRCKAKECDGNKYELVNGECKEKHILGKLDEMCKPAKSKAQLIYRLWPVKLDESYDLFSDGNYVKGGKNWCDGGDTLCECFSTTECMPGYIYNPEKQGCKEEKSGVDADMLNQINNVNNGGSVFSTDYSKASFGNSSQLLQRNAGISNSLNLKLR